MLTDCMTHTDKTSGNCLAPLKISAADQSVRWTDSQGLACHTPETSLANLSDIRQQPKQPYAHFVAHQLAFLSPHS